MRVRELHFLSTKNNRLYVSRTTTIGQRIFAKGYIPTISSLRRIQRLIVFHTPSHNYLTENGPVVEYTFRDRELPEPLFEYDELPFDDEPEICETCGKLVDYTLFGRCDDCRFSLQKAIEPLIGERYE